MNPMPGVPLTTDGTGQPLSKQARKLFQKNLALLRKAFGKKVRPLVDVDFRKSRFTTVAAPGGEPVLVMTDSSGSFRMIDHPTAPVETQARWFSSIGESRMGYTILLGFGAGHLTGPILERIRQFEKLVIVEPNPDLLAVAGATYDLGGLIETGKVLFWVPEDEFEAAEWVMEWLNSLKLTLETPVAFLESPQFVLTSPRFLWNFAARIAHDHELFAQVPAAVARSYPEPDGWTEQWASTLRFHGVDEIRGCGKGLPAVVVGSDPTGEEELEAIRSSQQKGWPVLVCADRLAAIDGAIRVYLDSDAPSGAGEDESVRVASIGSVSRVTYPENTFVYWHESRPTHRYTLPPYSTPVLLAEKGQLLVTGDPVRTVFDLATRVLGCGPIVLAGFRPSLSDDSGSFDLNREGFREQIRKARTEVFALTKEVSDWLPETSLRTTDEIRRLPAGIEAGALTRRIREKIAAPRVLPGARFPLNRRLDLGGTKILDETGKFLVDPDRSLLERIFQHNLLSLERHHPRPAEKVRAYLEGDPAGERYEIGVGPERYPRLQIRTETGDRADLPGCSNPWVDVARYELWKRGYPECGCVYLGIGLGFHFEALLERQEGNPLVWEPAIGRLVAAMHLRNLVPLFENDRVEWLVGVSADEAVGHLLNRRLAATFRHPPEWEPMMDPELRAVSLSFVRRFRKALDERSEEVRVARRTFSHSIAERARKCLRNSIRTARAIPLGEMEGCFGSVPAVIVSAGPSLDENVQMLNEVRDRAVIFVVDTAYRVVQTRDIDRHFVVTIDPKEETRLHFDYGFPRDSDLLLATSATPEEVWDLFKDPKVFGDFPTPLIVRIAGILGYEVVRLWGGGSVAISALGAAHLMGCDPLVLIGQDLAVLPDRTHATDTIYPEKSRRLRRVKEYEIPGLRGSTVKTTPSLLGIKRNLEHVIRRHHLNVINASAYGARIAGTREVSFGKVLEELPERRIPVREHVLEVASRLSGKREAHLVTALGKWAEELQETYRPLQTLLRESYRLKKNLERGKVPPDCGGLAAELAGRVIDTGFDSPALRDMDDFVYEEAMRYAVYERRLAWAPNTRTKLRWQLDRMIPLLEALCRGIDEVCREIRNQRNKVKE